MRIAPCHLANAFLFLTLQFFCSLGFGYASFIGYGYSNCMTCHYNPHGNGQLNDYGRALFASEIAARPFWNKKISDEELAKRSSFTFQEPTPRAIHPSFKYRDLYLTANPGGGGTQRRILMQADAGLAWHFDEKDKYILVLSAGYTPEPVNASIEKEAWNYHLISREHYLRMQLSEGHFLSVGLIDIPYGIRIVDHTALSRVGIGLDQNSQVHGVLYNYVEDKILFGLHGFVGNQMRNEIDRVNGGSATFEYEVGEKITLGASAFHGVRDTGKQSLLGFHTRVGVGKGSSLMAEWGLNRLEPKMGDATTGNYGLVVGTMRLVRGLDFETQFEMLKSSFQESSDELYRTSVGLIYFPFQRLELRSRVVDGRSLSPNEVKGDTWSIQSQLHLSL